MARAIARQAMAVIGPAGFRFHEDRAGVARHHDDRVRREFVVADQPRQGVQREIEADDTALWQRHAGRYADQVALREVIGLRQDRALGVIGFLEPGARARVVSGELGLGRRATAVGHLEPPGLGAIGLLTLERPDQQRRRIGSVELQALGNRQRIGPPDIEEAAILIADIDGGHRGIAPENDGELAQPFLVGDGAVGRKGLGLGERAADGHDHAQTRHEEALDRGVERGHAMADAAILELVDGAPAKPQERAGQRQHDQRHQRQDGDVEGDGAARSVHVTARVGLAE